MTCVTTLSSSGVGALYLHVPFCVRKCNYCDFASRATKANDPRVAAYVGALRAQLSEASDLGLLQSCATAYVGGGTPTLAGESLVNLVLDVSTHAPLVELTCEANPDSLSDDLLRELPKAGCTRLSIGVQSTNDAELDALGRVHSASQAARRVQAAVACGLRVSCDLMCATPCQTPESWLRSLAQVVSWGVGHVSVYPLAIEDGTVFGRLYANEDPAWNDPDVQAERMEAAAGYLFDQGFSRYEVASYARSGERCRHNIAYWTGVPYLGLGTSAASMLDRAGYERLRTACPQLPQPRPSTARVRLSVTSTTDEVAHATSLAGLHFSVELMSAGQAAAEDLMLGMRLVDGPDPMVLARAQEALGTSRVNAAMAHVVSEGLASWAPNGRIAPTKSGWLLGNELYGEMWDLAEGKIETVLC